MELPKITAKSRIGDFIPIKSQNKYGYGFILWTGREGKLKRLKNFK